MVRHLRTQLGNNKVSTFTLPLKYSGEQQRMQWTTTMQTYCHCWGNGSLALGGGTVHIAQQSQRQTRLQLHSNSALVCAKY